MLTKADQVGPTHALERLAQDRPVVGVVIAQERLVQPAYPRAFGDRNALAVARDLAQRIALGYNERRTRRKISGISSKCVNGYCFSLSITSTIPATSLCGAAR